MAANTADFSGHRNRGVQIGQLQGDINFNAQEQNYHHLFRLAGGADGEGYEWYKDRIPERIEGTCQWVLDHENFLRWNARRSGVLLITADPGCGKSVLAKYLADHTLSGVVCYFFFKDNDQNTLKQVLCALIHQLLRHRPALGRYVKDIHKHNGNKLVNIPSLLWTILKRMTGDQDLGPTTFVIDALDECDHGNLKDLIRGINKHTTPDEEGRCLVRYLLTGRPYQHIIYEFLSIDNASQEIMIPGEEKSLQIREEVNYVIQHRVQQLATRFKIAPDVASHLQDRLLQMQHRTYLMVYLVFDYLEEQGFKRSKVKRTVKGIDTLLTNLPITVDQAYDGILARSENEIMAKKALSIVLASIVPLTLEEMNVAVHIESNPRSTSQDDLDLEEDAEFGNTLRDCCGLLLTIFDGKVYFLHQTVREFLSENNTAKNQWSRWCGSVSEQQAHTLLTEISLTYLNFKDFEETKIFAAHHTDNLDGRNVDHYANRRIVESHPFRSIEFFDYCALHWPAHFSRANVEKDSELCRTASELCIPQDSRARLWFKVHVRSYYSRKEDDALASSPLMIASRLGLEILVQELLSQNPHYEKNRLGRTPAHVAAANNHVGILRIFADNGACLHEQDKDGMRPIHTLMDIDRDEGESLCASLQVLLDHHPLIDARTQSGRTALHLAALNGHGQEAQMLVDHNAKVDIPDRYGNTALHEAAYRGNADIVRMLIAGGADVRRRNRSGQTALELTMSSRRPHLPTICTLLDGGADSNVRCWKNRTKHFTLLHMTVWDKKYEAIGVLLGFGANVNAKDAYGFTPLCYFADSRIGHDDHSFVSLRQLLEWGADPNVQTGTKGGGTLLHAAAREGRIEYVETLLEHDANTEILNYQGQTPLQVASHCGHTKIVELLQAHVVQPRESPFRWRRELHRTHSLPDSQEGANAIPMALPNWQKDVD